MKQYTAKTNPVKFRVITIMLALLVGMSCVGSNMAFQAKAAKKEPLGGNYYFADFDSRDESIAAGHLLNEEIMEEGITLLKNDDKTLPLKGKNKISVFGNNSVNIVHGGAGSGAGSSVGRIDLRNSLENAGFEVNPSLRSFYENNGSSRSNIPGYTVVAGHRTFEMPVASYPESVKSSYEDYSDAAIIVISRTGGESSDLPRSMANSFTNTAGVFSGTVEGARSNTDHYLQLDKNETDLIHHVCDNFDKVIVLINSGSQFESGFLDDIGHYAYNPKIKAALWIGMPGAQGLNAVGKILNGSVNPSGKTVDTYARDFKADPTWNNFSNNLFINGHQYTNAPGGNARESIFYEEGIYVGYRYWETRGFTEGKQPYTTDGVNNAHINGTTTTEWEDWYSAHVVYPLGHGLSYTTFNQSIVRSNFESGAVLNGDDTIEIDVKVTNTGSVAGKDIVQIFYTAPYISGEIEKSHVVLGAFDKTKLLAPGEEQVLTLTLKVRDMASYDFNDANHNGFKGYELDSGNYEIKLMRNANVLIDSLNYSLPAIRYQTDEATGNNVQNLFDDVSGQITEYLSRNDFAGTFPQVRTQRVEAPAEVINTLKEWLVTGNGGVGNVPDSPSDPWYQEQMPATGQSNNIKLEDMIGLDYDDPLWEDFLDQFVVGSNSKDSGMNYLVSYGGWRVSGVSSLGVPDTLNGDGPSGWGNGRGVASGQVQYCSDTVLASTYNKELSYRKGIMIGNEALFGDGTDGRNGKYSGWYAPAVNIHRSPFSGRNFEYFSEDGYLTGIMGAKIVQGAEEKGVYCFVKHFGINDQETSRDGLITWASEQSMREIYLKGFEITVKEGKTTAIMSALNRIGAVWTGGSYPLLTELLRNEWGFRGMVITDYSQSRGAFMNINQMIRAGGDLALMEGNRYVDFQLNSATTVAALRTATKNICYTVANSLAMNTTNPGAASKFTFASKVLLVGTAGVTYNDKLSEAVISVEDDSPNITYSIKQGSVLPEGLELSPNGVISGVPVNEAVNHSFVAVATYRHEGLGLEWQREAEYKINIVSASGSILYDKNGTTLQNATINTPYTADVGGAEIYKPDATEEEAANFPVITYRLKPGSLLPEGLELSTSGIISGTPTKMCEDYEFIVLAQADGFNPVQAVMSIDVLFEATFSSKTLANGTFGLAYVDRVELAQNTGNMPVRYFVKEGSRLPDGLVLTEQGYIAGTPSETISQHTFVVVAKADFCSDLEATYIISVGIGFNAFELNDGSKGEEYEASVDYAQSSGDVTYKLKDGSSLPEGLTLSKDGQISGTPKKGGSYSFTIIAESDDTLSGEINLTMFVEGVASSSGWVWIIVSVGAALVLTAGAVLTVFSIKRKNRKS